MKKLGLLKRRLVYIKMEKMMKKSVTTTIKSVRADIESVVICGIGAAGSNTFLNLLYAHPAFNYTVVDFDKVEGRNVDPGTQPYTKIDLNRPKTQALGRIALALKNKRIEAINKKVTSAKEIEALSKDPDKTLYIDAFDNAESRNLFCKLQRRNVLHIGFSANLTGEAVWDGVFTPMEKSKADDAIDVCEMAIARPYIFALTAMAVIVIDRFIEKSEKVNLYFDSTLNIKKF